MSEKDGIRCTHPKLDGGRCTHWAVEGTVPPTCPTHLRTREKPDLPPQDQVFAAIVADPRVNQAISALASALQLVARRVEREAHSVRGAVAIVTQLMAAENPPCPACQAAHRGHGTPPAVS